MLALMRSAPHGKVSSVGRGDGGVPFFAIMEAWAVCARGLRDGMLGGATEDFGWFGGSVGNSLSEPVHRERWYTEGALVPRIDTAGHFWCRRVKFRR